MVIADSRTTSDMKEKRAKVANVYPGPAWVRKVNRMPPEQVTAIYISFQNRGLI